MTTTTAEPILKLRRTAQRRAISLRQVQTLDDLIEALGSNDPKTPTAMLRSLVGHLCRYFNKGPYEIFIRDLTDLRPRLRMYLQERRFKPNAVRAYVNFLRILLQKAYDFGWRQYSPELDNAWGEILQCVSTEVGCPEIVRFAKRKGKAPAEFSNNDLDQWAEEQLRLGRCFIYIRGLKRKFRRRISLGGLDSRFPKLTFQTRDDYGVQISRLPEPLRSQLTAILEWKTARYSPGRTSKSRHREITAFNLQWTICRLFGFVQKFLGREPSTLENLLCEEYIGRYVGWCLNVRNLHPQTVAVWIGMIPPLGKHPLLTGQNFAWVHELIAGLPTDRGSNSRERKARKWVDYDKLYAIPDQLLELGRLTKDPKRRALLLRDALVVQWLLVCPWRQKNLRCCRICESQNPHANLVYEEIPPLATIARTQWVEEALKVNPRERFWQFHFEPDETKNKDRVHAILPKQLVEPLEGYLANSRPLLVNGPDPGTLFLNDHGNPFSLTSITNLISSITLRWVGRRVTPHLFRDIFAVKYLSENPRDFLTLSKILWHRDVKITIQLYGANFDASYGARGAEEWLNDRAAKKKKPN